MTLGDETLPNGPEARRRRQRLTRPTSTPNQQIRAASTSGPWEVSKPPALARLRAECTSDLARRRAEGTSETWQREA